MILEAKRAVAEWLQHPTYGLAAVLATLATDGSDTSPSTNWTIADDTRGTTASDLAALNQVNDDVPRSCYVRSDDTQTMEGQAATYTHDGDIPIVLSFGVRAASPSAAIRDLDYTLRAALIVLDSLFNPTITDAVAAIQRNGVQLVAITSLQAVRTQEQLESNLATAHLRAVLSCRDTIA